MAPSFLALRVIPIALLVVGAFATIGTPLMEVWSRLDLLTHFRFYWIFVMLALAIYFFGRRWWWLGSAAAGLMLVCVLSIKAYDSGVFTYRDDGIRVSTFNLRASKRDGTEVIDYFTSSAKPDILLLTEVTDNWLHKLETFREIWPHEVVEPRKGADGIWLLSRYPIRDVDEAPLAPNERDPFISAIVETPHGDIRCIGIHAAKPTSVSGARAQQKQFQQLAETSAQSPVPVILFGDFNCTPFSNRFQRLLKDGALKETAYGFGLRNTWRQDLQMLPIDHVLVSMDLMISHHEVGPRMGSDHNTIIADIHLPLSDAP